MIVWVPQDKEQEFLNLYWSPLGLGAIITMPTNPRVNNGVVELDYQIDNAPQLIPALQRMGLKLL